MIGNEVVVCGWVDRWRDHGGVTFIDLRDREGILQVVFDPSEYEIPEAGTLRHEFVIAAKGKVRNRPEGMENPNLKTGKVEVLVHEFELLAKAETPPFLLHSDSPSAGQTDETVRLKYRYLDLRRPELQQKFFLRSKFFRSARNFYYDNGFIEVETPILYKSTPEGARDYLVPSRLYPGQFYALPQSPQTLKQLCMIAGFDRYFQIARCFRDEDLRADRQPEFTQIDVEMSFIDEEDIFSTHEKLFQKVFKETLGLEIPKTFPRLTYHEVMANYGSDKPDLRNPLKLVDLTEQGKKSEFKVYQEALAKNGILRGLCVEEKTPLSRKELDELPKLVAPFGAKGVSWIRIKSPGDWQAPQAKFFPTELKKEIESKLSHTTGAMLFMVCGDPRIVNLSMSFLRDHFGRRLGYFSEEKFNFLWVTDFPLFELDDEGQLERSTILLRSRIRRIFLCLWELRTKRNS